MSMYLCSRNLLLLGFTKLHVLVPYVCHDCLFPIPLPLPHTTLYWQQMADKAGDYMQEHGVKFIRKAVPTKASHGGGCGGHCAPSLGYYVSFLSNLLPGHMGCLFAIWVTSCLCGGHFLCLHLLMGVGAGGAHVTVYMLYMYVCVLCVLLPQIELVEEGPPRRLKVEFEYVETKEISSQEFNTVRDTPVILCLLALYVCIIQ